MIAIEKIKESRKLAKELRCVHRHSISEHPKCFARGEVKWPDDKTYSKITEDKWFNFPEYRIGYIDIESDGLDADFGTMLSWAIKEKGGDTYTSVITKEEIFNGTIDKRLTQDLVNTMGKFKILVGYYSTGFDIPFIRSKALRYNIDFPEYGDIYHWDLYYSVRYKLKLSRNSLDNVCNYLGIVGKTPIDKDIWRKAKYGDKEALADVLSHNIGDVLILEKLHDRIEFVKKWIKTSI